MGRLVYCSSADVSAEWYMHQEAFDASLVMHVLFGDPLLIPDVYFFVSPLVSKHLLESRGGRRTLLEECMSRGLAQPAFRGSARTFRAALRELQGAGDAERAIIGLLPNAEDLAERLDVTWEKVQTPVFHCWPQQNMGECYDALVVDRLQPPGDHLPERLLQSGLSEQMAEDIWRKTSKYRYACVEEGRILTAQSDPDGKGLRRGELLAALAWRLGLPRDQKIESGTVLIQKLRSSGTGDFYVEQFIKWLCECYQMNHAIEFSACPNFCAYSPATDLITRPPFADPDGNVLDRPSESLRCNARCPPLDYLLAAPPSDLIGLREEFGLNFDIALRSWAQDPKNRDRGEEVRRTLAAYCSHILARIDAPPTTLLHLVAGKLSGTDRKALSSAGAFATALGHVIVPIVGVVGAGLTCAYWLGRAVAGRKTEDWLLEFAAGRHEDRGRQNEFTLDPP